MKGAFFNLPIINIGIGNYRNTKEKIKVYEYHNHIWELKKLDIIKCVYDYTSLENEIDLLINRANDASFYNEK